MTKSQTIQWKTACWIAVGGFTAASAWFGWSMHQLFSQSAQPGSLGLMCGNSVTDPLGAILSFGTPISLAGVVGFVFLSHRGVGSRWSVVSAAVLTVVCTVALLVFGFRFFSRCLARFPPFTDCMVVETIWHMRERWSMRCGERPPRRPFERRGSA